MERDLSHRKTYRLVKVLAWQTINSRCLYECPQYLGKPNALCSTLPDVQNPLPQPPPLGHLSPIVRAVSTSSSNLELSFSHMSLRRDSPVDAVRSLQPLAKNRLEGIVVLICFFSFSKDARNKIRLSSLAINLLKVAGSSLVSYVA
ncbi:hypothetical protein H106_03092 [Trichophyton rubrum CBS 735.88]|nr:hypothetical protein H106_03092 [Trichophyton rubrum CBS 735.88]